MPEAKTDVEPPDGGFGADYPAGSLGADVERGRYVRSLLERYFDCRRLEARFASADGPISYAEIFESIETRFGSPTYFVAVARFDELVAYVQSRIDQTLLGRNNRTRGVENYRPFRGARLARPFTEAKRGKSSAAGQKDARNRYEGLLVLDTQGGEDTVREVIDRLERDFEKEGASVEQVQQMEKRDFSYAAGALDSGYFVNFVFHAEPTVVNKLRAKFKLDPEVYRQHYQKLPPKKSARAA